MEEKASSRKLWVLIGAFAVSILLIFGADAGTIEKISGSITAIGAIVAYILAEDKYVLQLFASV